jgi:spore coat protein U-like protein
MKVRPFGVLVGLWLAVPEVLACSVGVGPVAFGMYQRGTPAATAGQGAIGLQCPNLAGATTVTISLGPGLYGPSVAARAMGAGASRLAYGLYTDAARTTIWGDGSAASATVSDVLAAGVGPVNRVYPVYGRLPAGQSVPPGSYADSLLVTVSF